MPNTWRPTRAWICAPVATCSFANSRLSFYLEVTNLLNSKNECCIEDFHLEQDRNGSVVLVKETGNWLPMLPSFGFQWEF